MKYPPIIPREQYANETYSAWLCLGLQTPSPILGREYARLVARKRQAFYRQHMVQSATFSHGGKSVRRQERRVVHLFRPASFSLGFRVFCCSVSFSYFLYRQCSYRGADKTVQYHDMARTRGKGKKCSKFKGKIYFLFYLKEGEK